MVEYDVCILRAILGHVGEVQFVPSGLIRAAAERSLVMFVEYEGKEEECD